MLGVRYGTPHLDRTIPTSRSQYKLTRRADRIHRRRSPRQHALNHPQQPSTSSPDGQVGFAGGEFAPHPTRPQLGRHHLRPRLVLEAAGGKPAMVAVAWVVRSGGVASRIAVVESRGASATGTLAGCAHTPACAEAFAYTCGWLTRRSRCARGKATATSGTAPRVTALHAEHTWRT